MIRETLRPEGIAASREGAVRMTAGLDERRPDHTRPTIAFIVVAVAAAAVMTAGMTTSRPETPVAADRPLRVEPVVPAPSDPSPSAEPAAFPDFSMADVVTLAAAEVETAREPRRTKPRYGAAPAPTPTVRPAPTPTTRSGSTGSGSGGSAGTRDGSGGTGSGAGSGSGDSAGSGDSGGSTTGGSGTKDAGPGRSTTGRGKALGQKDTSPGRDAGSSKNSARTTGRR